MEEGWWGWDLRWKDPEGTLRKRREVDVLKRSRRREGRVGGKRAGRCEAGNERWRVLVWVLVGVFVGDSERRRQSETREEEGKIQEE